MGTYYDELHASIPTKKQHLSALRCFFDRLVLRHAVGLNPAASVRGERYQLVEGKTPEITVDQERALLDVHPPARRRGPPRQGDRRHSDLHRRAHRGGGRTQGRQLRPGRRSVVSQVPGERREGEGHPGARRSGTLPDGLSGRCRATVGSGRRAAVPQADPQDAGSSKPRP